MTKLTIDIDVKETWKDGDREDVRFDVEVGPYKHFDLNHEQLKRVITEVIDDL